MDKPIILFESYPNFSGSPYEVFLRMLQRGYGEKFCLFWAVDVNDDYKKLPFPSIPFIHASNEFKHEILRNTKVIIDSNRFINKISNNYRIHLRHGCSFKKCTDYYSTIGNVDAIITTSNAMREVDELVWPSSCNGKFIVTGLPSNDRLFNPVNLYENGFIKTLTGISNKFNKIIGWMPTFRQHRYGNKNINHKFRFGLPLIQNDADFDTLNKICCDKNVLLIIQMHHAQAANYSKMATYSNIKIVTQNLKTRFMITNGDLMGNFDALITDYSAAYHEYIILNRPIALTIDDIDEYDSAVGFCYPYTDWIKGDYCLTLNQLCSFIGDVANGADKYVESRAAALQRIHAYVDNQSSYRVIEYLKNKGVI